MGHKTRGAGIRQKQIAFLLPVIIIALTVLLVLTSNASDKVNTYQGISDVPGVYLTNGMSETEASLDKVIAMAKEEAGVCAVNYSGRTLSEYENIFTQIINTNDFVLGSGIWFEPYVYDPLQQYVGPYVYKDGDQIATTYDYSNADYDYFYRNTTHWQRKATTRP